ncbi:hypothetical protein [Microbulbifer sp. Q7]|uniref:hypothetical protein n=1 Tax=Microbulbifer sp. Q7 TaxID=1785091 RepID=UPI00082E6399|nr:hypothetical protein [Microbulbifer sp. Q7]
MKDNQTIREQLLIPGYSKENYTEDCPLYDNRWNYFGGSEPSSDKATMVRIDLYLYLELNISSIPYREAIRPDSEIVTKLVEIFPQIAEGNGRYKVVSSLRGAHHRRQLISFQIDRYRKSGRIQKRLEVLAALREGRDAGVNTSFNHEVRLRYRHLDYWYFDLTPSLENQQFFAELLPAVQGRYKRKPDVYAGIVEALAANRGPVSIAKEFGVSRSYVYKVKGEMGG